MSPPSSAASSQRFAGLAALATFALTAVAFTSVASAATKTTTPATKPVAKPSAKPTPAKATASATQTKSVTVTTFDKRVGVKGWEQLQPNEWPAPLDGVRALPIASGITIYQSPTMQGGAIRMESGKSVYGKLGYLAVGRRDGFVRVLIPYRPNLTIGWVREQDVTLDRVPYRVVIETDRNVVTVEGTDGVILTAKAGTGTNGTPTPHGLFYVQEVLPQKNPGGALGPVVLGLSGLSEQLLTFSGGFGRIGIHGTNTPGKLGGGISHGCVRVDNVSIAKMAKLLPVGTPVEIVGTRNELVPLDRRQSSLWMAVAPPSKGIESAIIETPAGVVPAAAPVAPAEPSAATPASSATLANTLPPTTVPAA